MTAIVSQNGELLLQIQGSEESIALNTPDGCLAVESPPRPNMFYADGWVDMPAQPLAFHVFNYATKEWIDPRSIEQAMEQKWADIKIERDRAEFGGFLFQGNMYDSDQLSQGRIVTAAQLGLPATWTLQDNQTIDLTAEQLFDLKMALAAHISKCHEKGRDVRQQIFEATSVEDLNLITF